MLSGFFCLIVLRSIFVHVTGLQSEKAQNLHQRELLSPIENTAINTWLGVVPLLFVT